MQIAAGAFASVQWNQATPSRSLASVSDVLLCFAAVAPFESLPAWSDDAISRPNPLDLGSDRGIVQSFAIAS